MKQTATLGISCNSRILGLAVISGTCLIDYRIQLRKDTWTPYKRERTLTSLKAWLSRYTITHLTMQLQYDKQISHQTKELIEAIKELCKERNIQNSTCTFKTLAPFYHNAKTKKEMMKTIAVTYPELSQYYYRETRNRAKHYIKLFEAVAVAAMTEKRLKRVGKS